MKCLCVPGKLLPKSRPPRGGRGLKYAIQGFLDFGVKSPPSRGAWIEIFI